MGVVYGASTERLAVAPPSNCCTVATPKSDAFARRFLNEARAVNIVRHPGSSRSSEFGKLPDGTLFYIMGVSRRRGPWTVASRTARAPSPKKKPSASPSRSRVPSPRRARKGIVHRDLQAGQRHVRARPGEPGLDWVKILDFGIAKVRAPPTGTVTDPEKSGEETGQARGSGRRFT